MALIVCPTHTKYHWLCRECNNIRQNDYYHEKKYVQVECKICKKSVPKVKLYQHMRRQDHLYQKNV